MRFWSVQYSYMLLKLAFKSQKCIFLLFTVSPRQKYVVESRWKLKSSEINVWGNSLVWGQICKMRDFKHQANIAYYYFLFSFFFWIFLVCVKFSRSVLGNFSLIGQLLGLHSLVFYCSRVMLKIYFIFINMYISKSI